MTSYRFSYGPRLIAGAGSSRDLAELLPPGPCLFVTDVQIRDLGLADTALASLQAAGIAPAVFDAVESDPSRDTLMKAVQMGKGCASVVGFGGGSPMDVAKLAAYLVGSGDDLDALWGVGKAVGVRLPLVLIPTTAGTGSEATPVTIITVGKHEKRGVSSIALIADWAILDPALTTGLPRAVTAATAIDAMVHAIEAYTSARLKNPMSDLLARQALGLLAENLGSVLDEPGDLERRGRMLLGAHLAGVAFANAPVAGVHALAYPLGGHFHVPHGLANAMMLAPVLGHNMPVSMPHYAELGRLLDPSLEALGAQAQAQAFVERMSALCRSTGLPSRLAELGIGAGDVALLAGEAMKQERLLINNPRPITEADARRLYEAVL
ncbi:iron-containing alcohol dehydrogenase [Sphingosinicella rhizophila]|uniref:Iron-containing alcohol dehydrogenase n=1 Tax=Sphingosinicella rhizophila TaxID=3050082 RepID=A0ABU3Q3D1_9SPHN|nr:iron-containing alcohol dehydrogenase [Sphingosinicella sp. GR2756]MDT9597822.1 iron-containing alcohol dehydrogenase [Sphingosinicella sp. GR2756]